MESNLTSYEALIASLAKDRGYTPKLTSKSKLSQSVTAPKMALIKPSTIVEREGRRRQRITSEVEFTLVQYDKSYSDYQRIERLSEMRVDLLDMIAELECDRDILEFTQVEITALSDGLTRYEELAIKAELTIVANYDTTQEDVEESSQEAEE